jgi:hypothetical protein
MTHLCPACQRPASPTAAQGGARPCAGGGRRRCGGRPRRSAGRLPFARGVALRREPDGSGHAWRGPDGIARAQALGKGKDVPAVFAGYLNVSGAKPQGTVRLLSTRTGGTVRRSSATANGTVGQFAMTSGLPTVAVRDQDLCHCLSAHPARPASIDRSSAASRRTPTSRGSIDTRAPAPAK